MNKLITRIVLSILVFLFIYNPPIRFLPMNTGIIIGGIFFLLYLVEFLIKIDLSKKVFLNRHVVVLLLFIGAIIGYSFLIAMLSGSHDLQVFKSYLSFLLFYLPGAIGIIHLLKKHYNAVGILQLFVLVMVIQSLIIVLMLVSPGLKDFFFSFLRDAPIRADRSLLSGGFKFLGFSFGTTWDLSIVQSIGIMLIALLCRLDKTQVNLKNALYFLMLSLSVFVSGRTGIFGIMFGILLLVIPVRRNEIPLSSLVKFSILLLLIMVPLYFIMNRFIPPQVADILQNKVLPWAFEMFQNNSGGMFETRSSNELKTMYFMPSFWTVLFGDGFYVNPKDPTAYYMNTDAGYMRHLLFYGVTGCILQLSIYCCMFFQMAKFSSSVHSSFIVKVFMLFLFVYFLLSHLKGDLLMGADMPIKLVFLLYVLFISFHSNVKQPELDNRKV